MPGDPYSVDPQSGTIYSGTPDNLGQTVDALYFNETRYTLHGNSLVPDDAGAGTVNLPADRTSYLVVDPAANTQVVYGVQTRQLNRYQTGLRAYALGGTVNVAMGDLGVAEVSLDPSFFSRIGNRLYSTVVYDEQGNEQVIVNRTPDNYRTNAELQISRHDPYARYLSPLEALRYHVRQRFMSQYQQEILDYLKENEVEPVPGMRAFSTAAMMLIQNSSLSNVNVYSSYWI